MLVLAGVAWGSLRPAVPSDAPSWDKLQHFAAYALLAALGAAALGRAPWTLPLALAVMGAGIEGLQAALPTGRTASLGDAVANLAGASLAWLLVRRRAERRS